MIGNTKEHVAACRRSRNTLLLFFVRFGGKAGEMTPRAAVNVALLGGSNHEKALESRFNHLDVLLYLSISLAR